MSMKQILMVLVASLCLAVYGDVWAQQQPTKETAAPAAVEPVPTVDTFVFRLRNGKEFKGFMGEKASFTMVVADTKVTIPAYKIQSIKFDANNVGKAFLRLRDGDSISAQIVPAVAELTADWGSLSLNTDAVASMELSK